MDLLRLGAILISSLFLLTSANTAIQNLHATHYPQVQSVVVEWNFAYPTDHVVFNVRHRLRSGQLPWKHIRTSETRVQILMAEFRDGDEIIAQVQAERGRHVIEDWSQELIITINKKITVGNALGRVVVSEDDMLPPLQFVAHVLDPTTVKLEWVPRPEHKSDTFYLINIKQLTSESGTTLQRQQVKTPVNSFSLGNLISGEKYELTIRSASSVTNKTSTTASLVEITMPKEEEYFAIGNVIISSLFQASGHGSVNMTWEVPPEMRRRILAYNVQYAEENSDNWKQIQFSGRSPSATLSVLKSNTKYVLKIETVLVDNIKTESPLFHFKTPQVEANPIQKVDVIYSHDVNAVKLQWMLQPFVQTDRISGYDVYLSEDKDKPDSQWRLLRLDTKEAALSLNDLKSSTVYYVRVNVRIIDGSVLKAPNVYRFKTIETADGPQAPHEGNSLSYRNVGPGQIEIKWSFPSYILDRVIGSTIIYTDRKDVSPEEWDKVVINDSRNRTLILQNLRFGSTYNVQIIPQLYTGEDDFGARMQFEMKIDSVTEDNSHFYERSHPFKPQGNPRFQQMTKTELEYIRIISCNPDAIKTGCSWNEMCITRVEDNLKGWCISNTLRDSILNS